MDKNSDTWRRRRRQWIGCTCAAVGIISLSFYLTWQLGERYEYLGAFFLFSGAVGFLATYGAGIAAALGWPRKWGALAGAILCIFMIALALLTSFIRDNSVYQP